MIPENQSPLHRPPPAAGEDGRGAFPGPVWVARAGAVGDMVMALPRLRFLARRHGAPVAVLARGAWCAALYAGLDYVSWAGHAGLWRLPCFWRVSGPACITWTTCWREHEAFWEL